MSEVKQEPRASSAASRLGAMLWEGALPEAYGLGLAAVLLLTLVSVLVFTDILLAERVKAANQARAEAVAAACAISLAGGSEGAAVNFDRLRELEFVGAARWLGGDGAVIRAWPKSPAQGSGAPTASAPATPQHTGSATGIAASAGIPGGGRLELLCEFASAPSARPALVAGGAAAAIAGTGLLVWVYRRMRRHVRPIAAVHQNLCAYASGLETQLAALGLSDSLGQVGQAWNMLIARVAQLQEEAQRSQAPDRGNALQRFESRALRQILDRLPLGIVRFNASEVITYANPAAVRLLRRDQEGLVGAGLADAIADEGTFAQIRVTAATGRPAPIDRKRGEGETQQTLRFVALPRHDGVGEAETVLTMEDTSHLQEAERARDNFLYHVTHELRTPLTNIQAYAETLTKPGFDDEQTRRECYNVIISETRRLSRLIEDILSISQLEVGTARIESGELDMVRLLRQMVQDNLGQADEKKIELTLKLPPKAPKVRGDKQRLSVLINNLIGNAIKYTPAGGQVTVTLTPHENRIEVEVVDSGIGISTEDQPHVFEKFYRASNDEVQQISGTGLGLAIAREVARLHGGDIRLKSEKDKGSTFTLELPQTCGETQGVGAA